MGYVLEKQLEAELVKPLLGVDPGVVRVLAEVAPDHQGEDRLYFRVVLEDDPATATASEALGKRLQKIATALRESRSSASIADVCVGRFRTGI